MRYTVQVKVKREGSREPEYGTGVLYVDEIPRILLRGQNKMGKKRQGKARLERARVEERAPSTKKHGRPPRAGME